MRPGSRASAVALTSLIGVGTSVAGAGAVPAKAPTVLRLELRSEPLTLVTATLDGSIETAETGSAVEITFASRRLFPSGSATLGSTAQPRIAEVAGQIEEAGPRRLAVFAYTGRMGSADANRQRSQRQAEAVGRALRRAIGGRAPTVRARGRGEADPISGSSGSSRRVVVRFSS